MYKSLLFFFLIITNSAFANIDTVINKLQPYFPSISTENISNSELDGFYEVVLTTHGLMLCIYHSMEDTSFKGCDRFRIND